MQEHEESITKHEQLLQHIEKLKIGSKISVRKLARQMGVSEGTAYRAVKEAENMGIVVTRERIGTVRIEKRPRGISDQLTFADVAEIVEGKVLGGGSGLDKTLVKYAIGAMKMDAMMRYVEAGSLLIVGNREDAHSLALEHGAAVLITGGFGTSVEVKTLADERGLPIISSRHDTFTVASMINRALFDRMIKKKIMLVEDIIAGKPKPGVLKASSTAADFYEVAEKTGYLRLAVVDEWNRVIGIVGRKEIEELQEDQPIEKVLIRRPITATLQTSLASAAQTMMWEGIDFLPIVDRNRKLIGTVTRREVLQAMRDAQQEPQAGNVETFDHLIWNGFAEERDEDGGIVYHGFITPQMATDLGNISEGILISVMIQAAVRTARLLSGHDYVIDNISTYFLRPVQIEDAIVIRPIVLESSRRTYKLEIEIIYENMPVSKSVLTLQSIDHG
ncbi:DRTGG domain-containing protein [Paenibacillus wulumuqiensis]|uniref:DRTGG domain-containing protein n=1 Tax=Paenibacillus wulumuqiensis TaxID=1567107 RepID=UPI0006192C5D|nr:DRTGG domain-containing protein [Paenibacillus wulumuqiensis]